MQLNNFYKPFSWVMIVVVLILSGTLFYLAVKKVGENTLFTDKELAEIPIFDAPPGGALINAQLAYNMIDQYHKKGRRIVLFNEKKLGLWHDSSSLSNYISVTFPNFKKNHVMSGPAYEGYEWVIGFYYCLCKPGKGEPSKLDVCLIPTLVNKSLDKNNPKRVIDFYNAINNPDCTGVYPPLVMNGKEMQPTADYYIYDTGEIWP